MSWLSKALKNNTFKIGATILAGGFAREYLYGQTAPSFDAFGDPTNVYKGGNFFGDALRKTGITPFADTGIGKSFIGTALEYMRPGGDNDLVSSALKTATAASRMGMSGPAAPQYKLSVGSQDFSGRQNFQASQTQMMRLGNSGAITAALGRDATQQYLARKVAGLRLPAASSLPTPMAASGTISTSAGRRSAYKKLTG
jgi:hypothetical protein